jgi:hypothetical protein
MRNIRWGRILVDSDGEVLCSQDPAGISVYRLMKFSQKVAQRYGLNSSNINSLKDLDSRMDRAIGGLEYEIYLKQGECSRLMAKVKERESLFENVV